MDDRDFADMEKEAADCLFDDLGDLFGTPSTDIPVSAAAEAKTISTAVIPTVPAWLAEEVYGGSVPDSYTLDEFIAAAVSYVEGLIEANGSCVLRNWPAWLYHALPFINSTLIKTYADLPSKTRTPYVATDDANVGSGVHAFTLQGEEGLAEECHILPASCEGRSKAALAEREWYARQYPYKCLLPPVYGPEKIPVMDVLMGVNREFRTHPKTRLILANSEKEMSLVWIDPGTGCICKARLDIWDAEAHIIWDVKKCRSISGFSWQIRDLRYDLQDGHYFSGAVACGLGPVAFGFLPCEAFPPYQVGCGYRDPDKLVEDCHEVSRLIGLIKESQMRNYWPNFPPPAHIYSWDELKPDDTVNVY